MITGSRSQAIAAVSQAHNLGIRQPSGARHAASRRFRGDGLRNSSQSASAANRRTRLRAFDLPRYLSAADADVHPKGGAA